IQSGEVRVDGKVVVEPGTMVDPARQRVTFRGRPLAAAPAPVYLMLNKPGGVITTLHDPEGRRTIQEFLPPRPRFFPLGRPDAGPTGPPPPPTDGAPAPRLMHPRHGVVKVYRLPLTEQPSPEQVRRLEEGVRLPDGGLSAPAQARIRGRRGDNVILDLAVHEGRYHLVRDMCETLGLRLRHLHRVAYGPLRLGELKVGRWRPLTPEELALLRRGAQRPRDLPPRGERGPRARPRPSARLRGEMEPRRRAPSRDRRRRPRARRSDAGAARARR